MAELLNMLSLSFFFKLLAQGFISSTFLLTLFYFFAKDWVSNRFKKEFEQFRVDLQHDYDLALNKGVRWQEEQCKVLSESWKLLVDAGNHLDNLLCLIRITPSFEGMNDTEFEEWIDDNKFSVTEMKFLKDAQEDDRRSAFNKVMERRDLATAKASLDKFRDYFDKNKIFLSPDVKEAFGKVDYLIRSAWVSKKVESNETRPHKEDGHITAYESLQQDIKPLVNEIETLVQSKLFPEETNK